MLKIFLYSSLCRPIHTRFLHLPKIPTSVSLLRTTISNGLDKPPYYSLTTRVRKLSNLPLCRVSFASTTSLQNPQGINMAQKSDCIFCQIVKKETKSWVIWESPKHMAFLSIFPNMRGVTVVISKAHKSSYAFDLEDQDLSELILAAKKVAKILDMKLEGVGRTALVLEGFGIDHVHVKLYPLPNTAYTASNWQPIKSNHKQYFDQYPGYVCSNDSRRASDEELDQLAKILSETSSDDQD